MVATNLREVECNVLNDAFGQAGVGDRLRIESVDATTKVEDGNYDHIGMVSVLTDPETFPQLSGVSYGRLHPVFVDVEAFAAERERARGLAASCLSGLSVPGLITTTFEEVAWVMEWAEKRGDLEVQADERSVDSEIVGDPIGFLAVGPTTEQAP